MAGSDGVRCMLMRGGTSKGAYFLPEDLPTDPRERDDLLLRIMGSPDPRQIDGIGGAHPLTSKVAIVSASEEPGVDLDYLFLQVAVDTAVVGSAQTCGNLLAGVGPFAVERGLVAAGDPRTTTRIRLTNTGDTADATFATPGGVVDFDGDAQIDGVPGTGGAIEIAMGAGGPGKPVLPTGNVADPVAGRRATLVDNGMPVVLLLASDLGLRGDETVAELEADESLAREVEAVRLAAGPLLGLGDVTEQSVPKVFLLSPARAGGAIATRAFIPKRVHDSIGVLMAASVAAGIRIPGAVGHDISALPDGDAVRIEHPSGETTAIVRIEQRDGTWRSTYSATVRTARTLFDGTVFPRTRRPSVQNGDHR